MALYSKQGNITEVSKVMTNQVFGLGNKKYKVDSEWVEDKATHYLRNITAVSNDDEGYVYVLQRSDPFMLIFSADGKMVNQWRNKEITDAHYMEVSPEGEVFVVERDHHRIVVFNKQGEILRIIGGENNPGNTGEPFNHPTDIAFSKDRDMFVSDGYGNTHVHHFNKAGELLHTWGRIGSEEGSFITPHSILVDQKERVLVADRENNRVQIFDQNGTYLKELSNVFHPMDIYQDNEGFIYVTDQVPALHVFNADDEFIGRCRTFGTFGHGLTVDKDGDIYIAEMLPDGLTKLSLI